MIGANALPGGAAATGAPWGVCRAFLRNRPIGEESVRSAAAVDGALRLRIDTRLDFDRFRLRQSVEAAFDPALRPEWCTIDAEIDRHRVHIEMEIAGERVHLRSAGHGGIRSFAMDLNRPPLFLPDNCFTLHALAACVARGASNPDATLTALPAFEDVRVTEPGAAAVLLGGTRFDAPTLTLRLRPDLPEHAWIRDGRIERLIIPPAQIRAEWSDPAAGQGGRL